MKKLARFGTGLVLTLAYACGISTKHVTASGDDGGSSAGQTNLNTGGAANHGGTGGITNGAGAGGASNRAGTGGGGSGGGSSACMIAPTLTLCEVGGGFYHDPKTNECLHTAGFECVTAPNAFRTLAECLEACPSAKPGMVTCDLPIECSVVSLGCCGLCPDASITAAQSVNTSRLPDRASCGGVACGACPPSDMNTASLQNYVPICSLGQCELEDISQTPIAECEVDGDCHLRDGADCCEQCDGVGFVALSSEALLAADVCGGTASCMGCGHTYDGYGARCEAGHCRVELAGAGNGGTGAGGNGASGTENLPGCPGSPPACRGFDLNTCCGQDPYGMAVCRNDQWLCSFSGTDSWVAAPGCNGELCGFGGQSGDGFGGQAGN
jgi:hypothetical protein